ncbi:MAG: fumarate hydratase [Candidatus Thermoplasmatota archaeon]|nr:fumarate hydratase [Candidatus Thermoplasmatota archaeon]
MKQRGIKAGIVALLTKAETELPHDVINALRTACSREKGIAKIQLEIILKNIQVARHTGRPMCQDTGIQSFFVTAGVKSPYLSGLTASITAAVKHATTAIPLRPNTVDPVSGKNPGDNTGEHIPAITWDLCEGDDIWITVLPKGGGSENMSRLGMLKPSAGLEGVQQFVVEEIVKAGGSPCPPTIVGIGIGGGADLAVKLAKQALLRPVGQRHQNRRVATLERKITQSINASGIGPMGLGGKTTVLDVHIETAHRHPASLPVGIVVQCWADRRATMVIHADGTWEVK